MYVGVSIPVVEKNIFEIHSEGCVLLSVSRSSQIRKAGRRACRQASAIYVYAYSDTRDTRYTIKHTPVVCNTKVVSEIFFPSAS